MKRRVVLFVVFLAVFLSASGIGFSEEEGEKSAESKLSKEPLKPSPDLLESELSRLEGLRVQVERNVQGLQAELRRQTELLARVLGGIETLNKLKAEKKVE